MDYAYDYSASSGDFETAVLGLLGAVLTVFAVVAIFSLVCYIFESIGVYTIAKRRGIKNAWLAWIPIGKTWMWGCIADQYQYVANGKTKNRRMIILILSLASFILSAMTNSQVINSIMQIFANAEAIEHLSDAEVAAMMATIMGGGMAGMFGSLVSIALLVFQYIALYDLYCSCNPSNSTMFLVLSIIFGITRPFFIFADRNKDLGMPARLDEPQPYQPREPWANN